MKYDQTSKTNKNDDTTGGRAYPCIYWWMSISISPSTSTDRFDGHVVLSPEIRTRRMSRGSKPRRVRLPTYLPQSFPTSVWGKVYLHLSYTVINSTADIVLGTSNDESFPTSVWDIVLNLNRLWDFESLSRLLKIIQDSSVSLFGHTQHPLKSAAPRYSLCCFRVHSRIAFLRVSNVTFVWQCQPLYSPPALALPHLSPLLPVLLQLPPLFSTLPTISIPPIPMITITTSMQSLANDTSFQKLS